MLSRMNAVGVLAFSFSLCFAVGESVAVAQQPLNWAEKMFSQLQHDFGTVARGADTRTTIYVTNLYEEDVSIANVGTTCGCTAAQPDRTMLKTHEKAAIEVKMNTVKFMRRKDSNVDVTLTFHGAKGAATKTVRVPITAYIRSDVVVTPEPGNADFGTVEVGQGGERHLEISYAGRDNWAIQETKVPNDHLEANLTETFRGAGRVTYQLVVRLKPTAPMGTIQDQVTLVTNDEGSPEVPVLVFGKVEPDIVVSPAVLQLGNLRPGEAKEFRVVLRGKRPFVISQIQCNAADFFEVMQPSGESKPVHIVSFKLTAPPTPGPIAEQLSFSIAGRPEPVVCKAEGKVVEGT